MNERRSRKGILFPIVLSMLVVAATLSAVATVSAPRAGAALASATGLPGSFATYTPAELWGGGSPAETCFTCLAQNVEGGASGAASIDPNSEVNPGTGDFSTTMSLFNVAGIGVDLGMSLTYDAQYAQTQSPSSPTGAFGWGWSSDFTTSVVNSAGNVTVDEENGSQVAFNAPPGVDGCPVGDYESLQKYTMVGSSLAFCGLNRLDAQMGDFPTYGAYEFQQSGGAKESVYNVYGLLVSTGNNVNSGFAGFTYAVAPGSGHCPAGSSFTCTVENDTGGAGGGTSGPSPRYIVEEVSTVAPVGQVEKIIDPGGNTYALTYGGAPGYQLSGISGPVSNASSGTPWQFAYATTSPNPVDLARYTDADGNATNVAYDTLGRVISETDPASYTTTYSYAYSSCVTCLGTGKDQLTTVGYAYTTGNGTAHADYDHYFEGLLISSSFGSVSPSNIAYLTWTYNYKFPGSSDQDGPTTETIVHPGAAQSATKSVLTFDAVGNVETSTDVNNNTTTSMYNDTGGNDLSELCWTARAGASIPSSASCSNPPSGSTTYTYDSLGHQTSVTDPLANTARSGYYAGTGLLCWTAPPTVTASGGACSGSGIVSSITGPPSLPSGAPAGATTYAYDEYGNVVFKDVAAGTSAAMLTTSWYSTNPLDELSWTIPPEGQAATLASSSPYATNDTGYNLIGQLTSQAGPDGQSTAYVYDADGHVLNESDPAGATSIAYDQDGRKCWTYRATTAVSSPSCGAAPSYTSTNGPTVYTYQPGTEAVDSVEDQNGHTTTYYYSDQAYPTTPTEVADPMNSEITYTALDNYGNPCVTGPSYPNFALPTQCNWVAGDTQHVYDAAGNLLSSTDPTGNLTTYQYGDAAYDNLVTSSTDPLSRTTSYQYDNDGRLTLTTEPTGSHVSEGYDADSRECWQAPSNVTASCGTPPTGTGVTTYSYNAASEPSAMQDNNGVSGAPPATAYSYTNGLLTSVSDDNARTVGYLYGYGGEVKCIAYPVASGSSCGSLSSPGTPSSANTIVDRGFDSALRQTSTADWLGNTTHYAYGQADAPGAVTQVTYPTASGESLTYSYDPATNLTGAQYAGPISLSGSGTDAWTYNTDNQVATTSQLGKFSTSSSSPNAYNQFKQVATATNPNAAGTALPADTYQYLANGSITSDQQGTSTPTKSTYDAAGELCWSQQTTSSNSCTSPPTGSTTYSFNANGQRTGSSSSAATTAYGWNAFGQLCWSEQSAASGSCSAAPSGSTTYGYDGNGLRSSATTGATNKAFTWDTVDGGTIPLDVDDGTNAYIYGPLLFGGTAPVEQIPLSGTQNPSYLASTPSGVQTVFGNSTLTSPTSSADKFTYGSGTTGTISAVGSLHTASGTALTTLSVSPATVGDLLTVSILATGPVTVSSLSGGGVSTWTKAVGGGSGFDDETWYGKVTTAGASTITATWSGSIASDVTEYSAQEFAASTGSGTTWSVDHTGTQNNTTSSSTITYPNLSPTGSSELYLGFATDNNATGGSTSGFTYANTATNNQVTYNPSVSSPSAYQPTGTQTPAGTSFALGTLFVATGSGGGTTGTISAVGSLHTASGTALTTLSVSPSTVGDMLAVTVMNTSTSVTVSSLSGGGVTTWTKAAGFAGSVGTDEEIWYGKVTTAGASTITATWSGSIAGDTTEYSAQEFSASTGSGTTWAVDHTGTLNNASSSTTTYPSLSPTGSSELYFGYMIDATATGGSTTGFTYATTSASNQVAYNPSVSSPSAYQPTGTQTPASTSSAVAATFTATGSGGSCPTGSGSGSGPIVTNVTPCSGSTGGGTAVTITGANLTGATAVKFGSTPATSYSVTSSTSISAVAPAGSSGPVDVTVTTPNTAPAEVAAYSTYGVQAIQGGTDVSPFGFQGSYTDPSGLIYLIGRYYDPSTDQFLSVDPDLMETGQPYAFTGDDPLNATDPLGLDKVYIHFDAQGRPKYVGRSKDPETRKRAHINNKKLNEDDGDYQEVLDTQDLTTEAAAGLENRVVKYLGLKNLTNKIMPIGSKSKSARWSESTAENEANIAISEDPDVVDQITAAGKALGIKEPFRVPPLEESVLIQEEGTIGADLLGGGRGLGAVDDDFAD